MNPNNGWSGPKYFVKKEFSGRYYISKGGACDLEGGLRDPIPRLKVRHQDEPGKDLAQGLALSRCSRGWPSSLPRLANGQMS